MKIAIVTGASSGIGREFVRQIEKRYSGIGEIWVIARRVERLKELAAASEVSIRCIPLDLLKAGSVLELQALLKREKPDVKILVNSAGYGMMGKFENTPIETETGMVRLNCEVLCSVTYCVLPFMSENSRILQMASSAAFLPQPGFAVYAATKSFVLSFSRALNQELSKRRISVTAVCPGPVDTEFFEVAEQRTEMAFYKKMTMVKAKGVVSAALFDADCGKGVSVYSVPMKLFRLIAKVIPHGILVKIVN